MQKTLANLAWEYRYDRRPFLIGGAALAVAGVIGLIYFRRRSWLREKAENEGWLDLAELEMRAYQQQPVVAPEESQEGLATGS